MICFLVLVLLVLFIAVGRFVRKLKDDILSYKILDVRKEFDRERNVVLFV